MLGPLARAGLERAAIQVMEHRYPGRRFVIERDGRGHPVQHRTTMRRDEPVPESRRGV